MIIIRGENSFKNSCIRIMIRITTKNLMSCCESRIPRLQKKIINIPRQLWSYPADGQTHEGKTKHSWLI